MFSILEDRSGIFWVGTAYGLNIMDRHNESFKRITIEGNEPGNISNNQINILYEDQSGVLWIGTGNGLNRLNREDQTFDWFLYKSGDFSSSGPHSIRAIHEDRFGTLWIGTEDRNLYYFDNDAEDLKPYYRNYQDDHQIASTSIYHILEVSYGKLWMGTSSSRMEMYG